MQKDYIDVQSAWYGGQWCEDATIRGEGMVGEEGVDFLITEMDDVSDIMERAGEIAEEHGPERPYPNALIDAIEAYLYDRNEDAEELLGCIEAGEYQDLRS